MNFFDSVKYLQLLKVYLINIYITFQIYEFIFNAIKNYIISFHQKTFFVCLISSNIV